MTRLCIIHPHPFLAQSLAQTLQSVWPEAAITFSSPTTMEEADIYLVTGGKADALPPERSMILPLEGKPIALKTLVQMLHALKHRLDLPKEIPLGACRLDRMTRRFSSAEKSADLTEKEIAILVYLYQRKTPATREDLLDDVWRYASDADTHTIETHIYRLRQKIEPNPDSPTILITTKGGYQLAGRSDT